MTNTVTTYAPDPDDDDGFRRGSFNSGRLIKGTLVNWNDVKHWHDRDGLTPPSPMLVIRVNEVLQRWKDNVPEVIDDKPLPDPDLLNAKIPIEEWEIGLDDKPRPPWTHTVVVYLVSLATGEFYTYTAATYGGRIAFDQLNDAVLAMRMLRGQKVMALVNLAERPFKTRRGMKTRPHFEIVDWKTPGGPAALPTEPLTSLPNADAHVSEPAASEPAASEPAPTQVQPPAPQTQASAKAPAKSKPRIKSQVRLGEETLVAMGDIEPVGTDEIIDDEVPF